MSINKMIDLDLKGKRVFIRADLNVPIKAGVVASDARILASIPTLLHCLKAGAKVMVTSHLGRPVEGSPDSQFSLQPVVDYLNEKLDCPVKLITDYLDGFAPKSNEIAVLENVRFNQGEKKNLDSLAKKYANLCDVFVMDAFGTAHREQASTYGVGIYAPIACAGPLLVNELSALGKALKEPQRPMVAIVGGSKVSTKLTVLESLAKLADQVVVGGGIANTFIAATGKNVGNSLYEKDLIATAKDLMEQANIPVATDVVCAKEFSEQAQATIKDIAAIEADDMILDIGPKSALEIAETIKSAKTILWNGPVGVFEIEQFSQGTAVISQAIADSDGFSIAGGGDTLAAIDKYNIKDKVSYISTGGGAFLEFVEGKKLPAVEMLEKRALEK